MSDMPNSLECEAAIEPTEARAPARKAWSTPKVISSEIFKETSGPTLGAPESSPSVHSS